MRQFGATIVKEQCNQPLPFLQPFLLWFAVLFFDMAGKIILHCLAKLKFVSFKCYTFSCATVASIWVLI